MKKLSLILAFILLIQSAGIGQTLDSTSVSQDSVQVEKVSLEQDPHSFDEVDKKNVKALGITAAVMLSAGTAIIILVIRSANKVINRGVDNTIRNYR